MGDTIINVGVIGYGYWGPNVLRNFVGTEGAHVVGVCDIDKDNIKRALRIYPFLTHFTDYRDIIASKTIDAVAIVTPVSTHYKIAKAALENGKHVFVEKPFTANSKEAEALIALAEKKKLKIMVDHTFLFTGAVRKIKELIDENALGNLYYYDSTRVNMGLFQHDVNVIWDLAPHDFSIMDYVMQDKPIAVVAHGIDHFNNKLENVAYITMYFQKKMIAHFNVNWLSPVKIRMTCVGGSKKMLVWNDLEADEKIRVYDKGVNVHSKVGTYKMLFEYRSGDMWGPKIDYTEALKLETKYFIKCIITDRTPINDGYAGLRVVKMLEAAKKSLMNRGKPIRIQL
jgi:predicted dehydrogenase